ncbi:MAG TPA: hypothetical protein PLM19_01705 [Candidatus Syntrophosphaera sp.]|nr:hypothetical protein [Candidatus Cloacimonadota bacterium]HOR02703.1 hypothetical protein [Candidatus Syntrophosphaera sp.]
MRQTWYIHNLSDAQHNTDNGSLQTFLPGASVENGLLILLDGYVLPRQDYFEELSHYKPLELIRYLRAKYAQDFIHYLKGSFCILLMEQDGLEIYTDRHNINNYFVYASESQLMISNSIAEIASRVKLEVDVENSAIFTLLSHFICSGTMFKNLSNSEAGTRLSFKDGGLHINRYWQPEGLVKKDRRIISIDDSDFALTWKRLAEQYLSYLHPVGTSITITAGNDSRMVLAALLALGNNPQTFTFGNPASYEAVVSAQVAKAAGLEHSVYYVNAPDPAWMEGKAKELMDIGGGLISIQRAHRLDAYNREKLAYPDNDIIFTGLMGGEYVKMPPPGSSVLPSIIRLAVEKTGPDLERQLIKELTEKGFKTDIVDITVLMERIKDLTDRIIGLSPRERSFVLLYLFYGCAHHTQEARLLGHLFRYPVHLFMDVDFLEALSSSANWYPNNNKAYNRLTHSRLMVSLTHLLAPQLSKVPYGKKGQYSAEDMLLRPWFFYLKRLRYLVIKERNKYPVKFVMGRWMHEFCGTRLEAMQDYLGGLFDLSVLEAKNKAYANGTDEYSWQYLTNPINLGMIHEHYTQV